MPTEERKATPQPKLDAEAALAKVLELIRGSKSIDDFTAEKVAAITGLQMHPDGPDRFGANEVLTTEWWYSIEMNRATLSGPKFMFAFYPVKPDSFPDATPICGMDFAAFSQALESSGFLRETRYGEHGRIDRYDFERDKLLVSVFPRGEASESPEKVTHHCIWMIIVR
jgi:hypothetical protein